MIVSTRNELHTKASLAILEGLAKDKGLYIFDTFNKIDLNKCVNYNYQELSVYILSLVLDDYSLDEIRSCVYSAYDDKFDCKDIVKIHKLNESADVLELYHGPTLAFKDMALTILPHLFTLAKKKNKVKEDTIILTATSGDTGGASLSGFKDVDGVKLIVFYPNGKVSKLQEKQMLSFKSKNAKVIAYDGNFDDTQNFVKAMFNKYPKLSSSNSINLGRLVPQIVYYVYGYLQMVKNDEIKMGDKINVCVPTGNFGNILAAYIAYKMGLPVNKFICASNKNKVLADFFNTGVYDINRSFFKTNSPSMDILISSNLERLLYLLFGSTNRFMDDLKNKGRFELNKCELDKLNNFYGNYLDEEETLNIINKTYNEEHYLIDTHTAVSLGVYYKYKEDTKDNTKTLVVSTASPYKFAPALIDALGIKCDGDEIEALSKFTNTPIPKVILGYKDEKKEFWAKEDVNRLFEEVLKEFNYEEN